MHRFGCNTRGLYVFSCQFWAQNLIFFMQVFCHVFGVLYVVEFLQTDYNNFKPSHNLIYKLFFAFLVLSNSFDSHRWRNPTTTHEIFSFHIWRRIPRFAPLLTANICIYDVRQSLNCLCLIRLFQSIFVSRFWCTEYKDSYAFRSNFHHVIFKRLIFVFFRCVFSVSRLF